MGNMFSVTDISASGLAAERLRLEVVANNIANANSTRTPEGGPYRRQQVVFESALQARLGDAELASLSGVHAVSVQTDSSELPRLFQPDHPDADRDGYVTMPNVQPAIEMVDMITASRAYEANLQALRSFREMAENALGLLRST